MRRREFLALIAGSALAWPLAATAQQKAMPVIGWLSPMSAIAQGGNRMGESGWFPAGSVVGAFHQGLNETGYVEGQNVAIEYRWAQLQYDRLPALASDLVARRVAVIAATGGGVSPLAAKAATTTIPIVFVAGDLDPVETGLVASLNRPGGNITGVTLLLTVLGAKRLQMVRELVPTAAVIGVLVNPSNPGSASEIRDLQQAAQTLGIQLEVLRASADRDLDAAFATLVERRAAALLVGNDSFFISRRDQLVALAARHALPTMYFVREFAAVGGLMSYGTSNADAYHLVGAYVG